eukprot:jgi/Mesvir1/18724/Mv01237-RA.1
MLTAKCSNVAVIPNIRATQAAVTHPRRHYSLDRRAFVAPAATRKRRPVTASGSLFAGSGGLGEGQATPYRSQSRKVLKNLILIQSVKSLLHYLQETSGELHLFLHNYVADHPLPAINAEDSDEWLVELAATPFQNIANPGRSSIVCDASLDAATTTREVSPRDVAERIIALSSLIAQEFSEDALKRHGMKEDVLRR